jgi:hypothetical protein
MSYNYSSTDIEKLIDGHAVNKGDERYLNSLNVNQGSIVIYKGTLKYYDEENHNNLYYEVPFHNGDSTDGYNEGFAKAFIVNNIGKKIKLLTVGKVSKLEFVTLYPNIIEMKGKKYIKLDRSCCFHESTRRPQYFTRRPQYYSGDCYDCGKSCGEYKRCYTCNRNYNYY